jgi:hypothetical protein
MLVTKIPARNGFDLQVTAISEGNAEDRCVGVQSNSRCIPGTFAIPGTNFLSNTWCADSVGPAEYAEEGVPGR